MAIKINGQTVVNDDKKGLFKQVNPGTYTTAERDALTAATGDIIYNSDESRLEFWDGSSWQTLGLSTSLTAGIIDNLTLVDDDTTDNDRFTNSTFTATVTMVESGVPNATKGIKASVTALLDTPIPLAESLDTVTNSVTTDEFNTPIQGTNPQTIITGSDYANYPIFIDDPLYPRFQLIERHAGYGGTNKISQFIDIDSPFLTLYNQNNQGTGDPDEAIFNYRDGVCFSSFHGPESYTGVIWVADDPSNTLISDTGHMYCTDGNTIIKFIRSGNNLSTELGTFTNGAYNSGTAGSPTYQPAQTPFTSHQEGFIFYDTVNSNIVIAAYSSSGTSIDVKTAAYTSTGNGTATMQSYVTNGSYGNNISRIRGAYDFGVNGQYLIIETSDSTQIYDLYKWNTVTQQLDRKGQLPQASNDNRIGLAIYNGVLYYSAHGSNIFLSLYKSNSDGALWTLLRSDQYSWNNQDGYQWYSYGLAIGLNIKLFGLRVGSGSVTNRDWLLHIKVSDQTATITTASNLSSWANTESIAKLGDEDNADYRGVIANINYSTGSFKLITAGEWSVGDTVVSTTRTSSNSVTKYLTIDSVGNVTDLASSDPGYVDQGLGNTHTLSFPATFTSGDAPDTELPEGTSLQVQLRASNSSGTDTAISNAVTP